ncbi:response regulator [Pseudomonas sp. CA3A]|uniref:histidine kinase n=1 Tax=Pseudomonas typographi TaxID=2715964 RepID=A0ABR7YXA6_9PSED|nr:ATP-binding protein [Pseudomonas typographi]MBD1597838.1 response regulator [Pseudomonas typographi]
MTAICRVTTITVRKETDIVTCRQGAKHIAGWLGLPTLEQIRLATAVSELARNIYQYAGAGAFHFELLADAQGQLRAVAFEAFDHGQGIGQMDAILNGSYVSSTGMGVGLRGAQRLMDEFDIQTSSQGTRIRASKYLVPKPFPTETAVATVRRELASLGVVDPYEELNTRGSELLLTTGELQAKQQELEAINHELENTNKGVVALYSELEKASQELQQASEAKSRFFSNMTHEFRTPINIIENISKLLLNGNDGRLNEEQHKQVSFISSAAAELAEMVNELLDLAQAESGRIDVNSETFELTGLLEQLHDFMMALGMRYPSVSWHISPVQRQVQFNTDRGRLFQILRNLISNAFKYTAQGAIEVRVFVPNEEQVEFVVQDTGAGIAAENLERVFEEFARVRMPGMAHVQGNGLGLPLAKRLAQLLKGDLTVTSQLHQGSCFTAVIAREFEPAGGPVGEFSLHGHTVLIIDDNEADRYLLRQLLAPYGPLIIEAGSASASIDKLHAVRPDLIFLDLELPDIYGADLLDSMDWAMHARVLINTAKTLTDQEAAQLAAQCAGVLFKSQGNYAGAVLRQVGRLAGSLKHAN